MTDGFEPVADFLAYDFRRDRFEELPAPEPRISPRAVAWRGKLFVVGGSSPVGGEFRPNPKLEVYDPERRTWTTVLESLPFPASHLHLLALDQGLLIVSTHNVEGRADLLLVNPRDAEPVPLGGH